MECPDMKLQLDSLYFYVISCSLNSDAYWSLFLIFAPPLPPPVGTPPSLPP